MKCRCPWPLESSSAAPSRQQVRYCWNNAMPHEDHRQDDDETQQKVLVLLKDREKLRQRHQNGRSDYAADHRSQTAKYHHRDEFDRVEKSGLVGIDEAVHQSKHGACDRCIDRGNHEGLQLEATDVDTDDTGGNLAVVKGPKSPPGRRLA